MSFELEGDGQLTPESVCQSETVHGSLYGFEWKDRVVTKCSDNLGLYRVEFHTNAAYLLVSTLSLGLYVPQTVEWTCQAPIDVEEEGEILGSIPGEGGE